MGSRSMDEQCGLCLSCGAPFMLPLDEMQLFNRRGNQSLVYINQEFRRMLTQYTDPKFTNISHSAHLIHIAHHSTALDFMCNKLERDSAPRPTPGLRLTSGERGMAYYKTPSKNSGPQIAGWIAPSAAERLDFSRLLNLVITIDGTKPASLDRRFSFDLGYTCLTCSDCNIIMTQEASFKDLLGFGKVGASGLIQGSPISVFSVQNTQAGLPLAYGNWMIYNQFRHSPMHNSDDVAAPHLAYYLHMCLPSDTTAMDGARSVKTVRRLYLELCWVVLEIACLCNTIKNYPLSHGKAHHMGAIELYASYFSWRLLQFEHYGHIPGVVDFVQWHQKYFWAIPSSKIARTTMPVSDMCCNSYDPNPRTFLQELQEALMDMYSAHRPLHAWITGNSALIDDAQRKQLQAYFVTPSIITKLKRLSARSNDFDAGLGCFGIDALTFRIHHLCREYTQDARDLLKSFRSAWRQREIQSVQLHAPGADKWIANAAYLMCQLRYPPDRIPDTGEQLRAVLGGPKCSPWKSVFGLRRIKAFRTRDLDRR